MNIREEPERGMWNVSRESFHYRLYEKWFELSRKGPLRTGGQIDLCHYMRAVMIWVWFRLFFFQSILPEPLYLTPLMATILLAAIGGVSYLTIVYPHNAGQVWLWAGIIAGIALVTSALIVALVTWHDKSARTFEKMVDLICWPFLQIRRGAVWFFHRVLEAPLIVIANALYEAGFWFFQKTLFWYVKPWWVVPPLLLGGSFWISTKLGIIVSSFLGSVVLGGVLVVLGILLFEDVINPWRRRRAQQRIRETREVVVREVQPPSQFSEFLRLIWQVLVAKKMKICPLIVPEDGRTI